MRTGSLCLLLGSSPLARGLLTIGADETAASRIIPARAGFTWPRSSPSRTYSDHPRSRGVYGTFHGAANLTSWIIPARAGFTQASDATNMTNADHPRSRGVYVKSHDTLPRKLGSSPLARGLRPLHHRRPPRRRIIPARAGFTRPFIIISSLHSDHPRSRGVYGD